MYVCMCVCMHVCVYACRMEVERAAAAYKLKAYLLERIRGKMNKRPNDDDDDDDGRWDQAFYLWMMETKLREAQGRASSSSSSSSSEGVEDPILPQVRYVYTCHNVFHHRLIHTYLPTYLHTYRHRPVKETWGWPKPLPLLRYVCM